MEKKVVFKGQNISKISEEKGVSYYGYDVLRQTTIERLCFMANKYGWSAEILKRVIKSNVSYLLDLMIKEEK